MNGTTLAATLWPTSSAQHNAFRVVVLVVLGVALMTVTAKFRVWIGPVPISMQTFGALLIGMAYGPRLGAASLAAYLATGLAGLPVFAGEGAGPAYLVGPTAGFLVGFAVAAAEPGTSYPRLVAAEGACPPEDVGGYSGYADYLEAISDPTPGCTASSAIGRARWRRASSPSSMATCSRSCWRRPFCPGPGTCWAEGSLAGKAPPI